MGRKLKIDEFYVYALKRLEETSMLMPSFSNVMRRKFGVSRQAILSRLKAWQNEAIIQINERSKEIAITEKGRQRVADNLANPLPQKPQTLRIHSLAIAFPLRTPLAPSQPAQILQSKGLMESLSGLRNQQSAYTQDGLLTPSSLILYLPELELDIHSDPRLAIKPLLELAMRKAEDYEVKLGVRLRRLEKGCLVGTIIMNHNANTENAIAKTVLEKLKKFEVKDEEGNVRLIVDFSDGVPEFEAINPKNAIEDITKAQDFYLGLLQGRFDYRKAQDIIGLILVQVEQQSKIITQQAEAKLATDLQIQRIATEFNLHAPVLQSTTEANLARAEADRMAKARDEMAIARDEAFINALGGMTPARARRLRNILARGQRTLG